MASRYGHVVPAFVEKYTPEEREAVGFAYVDRKITAPRVVELAAAGELTLNGKPLEPFEIGEKYVRKIADRLRKRRAGQIVSDLATATPRDAIEALRRRLVSAADQELAAWERMKPGNRDLERFRQIIRCVREAQAIAGPKDPRPVAPGSNAAGKENRTGGDTASGLAGQILKAAGAGGRDHARNGNEPAEAGS